MQSLRSALLKRESADFIYNIEESRKKLIGSSVALILEKTLKIFKFTIANNNKS